MKLQIIIIIAVVVVTEGFNAVKPRQSIPH
jgi:hypothetical protein